MTPRTTLLPFALPDLGDSELQELEKVLESGWITTGSRTHRFEAEFAEYVGASHAIAVNSCTAAMHLSLEAIGVGPGDFVLTTPYTFAATAEVVRYLHAIPVLVDVEPDTLNMDPRALVQTIEDLQLRLHGGRAACLPPVSRALRVFDRQFGRSHRRAGDTHAALRAVMPVDIAGHPYEMEAIADIAEAHGLFVVEDAAHACSAAYKGRRIGGTSVAGRSSTTCFSFYATKTLATGEGGMITTDREDWAERMRVMSLHGISKDAWKRYASEGHWYYEIVAPGFKYNMPDLTAALGLVQLHKVEQMRLRRAEIAERYNEAFADCPEIEIPTLRPDVTHAWHLYMLRLRQPAGRDEFIADLKARNVSASVHFIPLHLHPYYRTTFGYGPDDLPVASREYRREVSLPIYSKMTEADVESVIDAVILVLAERRARVSSRPVVRRPASVAPSA